jgi:hypothetical protein
VKAVLNVMGTSTLRGTVLADCNTWYATGAQWMDWSVPDSYWATLYADEKVKHNANKINLHILIKILKTYSLNELTYYFKNSDVYDVKEYLLSFLNYK